MLSIFTRRNGLKNSLFILTIINAAKLLFHSTAETPRVK